MPIYEDLLIHRPCSGSECSRWACGMGILEIQSPKKSRTCPSAMAILSRDDQLRECDICYPQPAIILTCRIIAIEAAPILYRCNTLEFTLNTEADEPHPSARGVKNLCRKVFSSYGPNSWNSAPAFQSCEFAAFLNIIGPSNAASLTSISFWSHTADQVAICLPVATELIAAHCPNVQYLRVHLKAKYVDEDSWPRSFRPDLSLLINTNGPFWPLFEALENLAERVEWLKRFEYKGHPYFSEVDSAYGKLKGLENWVERRAKAQFLGERFDACMLHKPSIGNPWRDLRDDPGFLWHAGYAWWDDRWMKAMDEAIQDSNR